MLEIYSTDSMERRERNCSSKSSQAKFEEIRRAREQGLKNKPKGFCGESGCDKNMAARKAARKRQESKDQICFAISRKVFRSSSHRQEEPVAKHGTFQITNNEERAAKLGTDTEFNNYSKDCWTLSSPSKKFNKDIETELALPGYKEILIKYVLDELNGDVPKPPKQLSRSAVLFGPNSKLSIEGVLAAPTNMSHLEESTSRLSVGTKQDLETRL